VETYLAKTLQPYFDDWLDNPSKPLPLPLGTNEKFHGELDKAKGDPDVKVQAALSKRMGFGYRKAIGELISTSHRLLLNAPKQVQHQRRLISMQLSPFFGIER
jgi:hypothetical protein